MPIGSVAVWRRWGWLNVARRSLQANFRAMKDSSENKDGDEKIEIRWTCNNELLSAAEEWYVVKRKARREVGIDFCAGDVD